ncbi:MAG: SMC domain protein, partial [Candidatus Azambacteria bacterium GW2011_GWA1_44_9]
MVPTKLQLSNFTSYGQDVPTLDFKKIHLAAISGVNGAGKSSLLDAITWCIWGTSRLGDSADQLIRLGQKEMWVQFSFELDNHIFTIKRSRVLKGAGSTTLDFTGSTSSPQAHNLTEGTIKATQQKIIDALHLTYETFTNSAFLRQGHADEFTTKGAMDRKRILADILGLSHFDELEEKAKEKIKEIQSKLSQKEERSEKKKEAEGTIAKVETEIKSLEEKLKLLQKERETLKIASEQRKKLEQNFLQNKKELEEILNTGKSRKEKIDLLKNNLEKLKGAETELSQLKELQGEKEKMDEVKNKKLETEKNLSEVLGTINLKKQRQHQIQEEIEKLNNQIKQSTKAGAKCPTCGQEIGKLEKDHVKKELSTQIDILEKELAKIDFSAEEKTS